MVAEGNEVGKISIRVVPNLDDFHDDLKRQLAEEEKKRHKVKIGVDTDTSSIPKDVKKAENSVGNIEIDVVAGDTKKLISEVEKSTDDLDAEVDLKANLDRFKRRYKNKFQALIADFESNIPLTANGELIRKSLKGLEEDFEKKLSVIDPDDDINTIVRLRREVEKFYRITRESAPELLGKNVSQETKQRLNSLSELTQFGAKLAAQMVEFDRAVAESKAKSDRIWSDADYRLRISVDDGEIVKVRRSLSERVVVPVSIQAQFDRGGFTRSAAIAVAGAKELTSVVASPFKLLGLAPGIAAKAFARLGPEVVALTALIAALLPPVLALGAGLITLAPAALAALVPFGAIALGLDGIKKAAETAKPAFEELKKSVSSVFENGLPGQNGMVAGFKAINDRLIPEITASLKGVAQSITNSFNGVVGVLASPKGLGNLNNIFDNVAAGIENAKGGLKSFTEGILQLVSAISNKFPGLGQWFTDLGAKFSGWVDKFTSVEDSNGLTGLERTIQNVRIGIEGLTGVFQAFFSQGLKDIQSPDFGAGMKRFFDSVQSFVTNTLPSLTEGFKEITRLLQQLEPLLDTFGALTNLSKLFVNPGETINDAAKRFEATGSFKDALTGLGPPAEQGGQEAAAGLNKGLETGLEQTRKTIEASLQPPEGGWLGGGGSFDGGGDGVGAAVTGKVNEAVSAAKSTLIAFQGEFASMIAQTLQPLDQLPAKLNGTFANLGAAVGGAFGAVKNIVAQSLNEVSTAVTTAFENIPTKVTSSFQSIQQTVTGSFGFMVLSIGQQAGNITNAVQQAFNQIPSVISGALGQAVSATASSGAQIVAAFQASIGQLPTMASEAFTQLQTTVQAAMDGMVAAVTNGGAQAVAAVQGWSGQITSALESLSSTARASGEAVGREFAGGISSQSGAVAAAAQELMAAARQFFPSSPAEAGPFSGSGWVDKSGESVGEGFASGLSSSQQEVVETARALMQAVKDIFDSVDGLTLNFNMGPVTQQAEAATKQVQVFGDTLSKVPPLKELSGLSPEDSARRDELSQQLDLLEMERKSLELEKGRVGANNDAIKARLAEIKEQKLQLGLQKDQLDYAKKYGEQVDGSGSKMDEAYKDLQKTALQMPLDFAKTTRDQFLSDIGISGGGALGAIMDYGLDFGSQFIFNVSNVQEALTVKANQLAKQGAGMVGR